MKRIQSGVTAPQGFIANGLSCGLKRSGKPDLGIVVSTTDAIALGAFTRNKFRAAPVKLDAVRVGGSRCRGVLVNSGNANACTGLRGDRDALAMTAAAERALKLPTGSILVCSTGIIGHYLPMEKVRSGIASVAGRLSSKGGDAFSAAIMTTDTCAKTAAVELTLGGKPVRIGGTCKGSGMINPHLATMLAFITTDADIPLTVVRPGFALAVERTFNCVTVDGDSSTNDTVLLLANGAAKNKKLTAPEIAKFNQALQAVMADLAMQIARDGEGATKLVEIRVTGAKTEQDGRKAAKAIANSPLVKTALFGNDPNWGRILCAVGYSGAEVDPGLARLRMCGTLLVKNGRPTAFKPAAVSKAMAAKEIRIEVELAKGRHSATVWTCDFSYDYVKINAEYHT